MLSKLAGFAGLKLAKRMAEKLARWVIKTSKNKIDDAALSIADKVRAGNFHIEPELEILKTEYEKYWINKE